MESSTISKVVGRPEARSGISRTAEAGDKGGSVGAVRTAEEREELESRGINPDWDRRSFLLAVRDAAKENGVWLDKSILDGTSEASNHRKNGTSENDVYFSADGKSVIKLNNLSYVKGAGQGENMSALMDRFAGFRLIMYAVWLKPEGGSREEKLGAGEVCCDMLPPAIQQESPEAYGHSTVPLGQGCRAESRKGAREY